MQSSLSYRLYTSCEHLPSVWHHAFDGQDCLHPNQLSIIERSRIPDLENYYVVVCRQEKPIFFGYYQLLHVKPIHFNHKIKCVQKYALDISLRVVRPTLLVAGNLFRHDATFHFFTEDLDPVSKSSVFLQATEYVLQNSKATGVFLKDVPAEYASHIQQEGSYKQMADDICMCMSIPSGWSDMSDYQKALKHKYLQRYRKTSQQLDGIQIRELSPQEIEERKTDIFDLYLQVSRNQLVSMGILSPDFFPEMKQSLGHRFRVCGWFLHDRLVAFTSAILHGAVYDMNYIGFDYAINQSHAIYFNILFHCLEQAIRSGSKSLMLGRTALEAKAILGCKPEYQYGFYKLRHPLVNWFFKKISAGFRAQQGERWKERHPFKSTFYHTMAKASTVEA